MTDREPEQIFQKTGREPAGKSVKPTLSVANRLAELVM